MKKRIAIIDADGDIVACAARNQIDTGENETPLPLRTVDECLFELRQRWEEYEDAVGADQLLLMFSDPKSNWRKRVLPSYKANRAAAKPFVLRAPIRSALLQNDFAHPTRYVKHLEADDLCGIASTAMQQTSSITPIIISPDKDMRTIPGLLWNPRPTATGAMRPIEEITEDEAFRFHMRQTLEGDTVDNYKGCPGIGPVKALQVINRTKDKLPSEVWEEVVATYESKGFTMADALQQAQVSRILRYTDWNKKTGKIKKWTPPNDE